MWGRAKKPISLSERFGSVFAKNLWGDSESSSGEGSRRDSHSVQEAVSSIDTAIREYGIKSIVDIPCGDFNWMPLLLDRHEDIDYHGFDIVPELIDKNKRRNPRYKFSVLDLTTQIPPTADLLFCKDLVNHLLNSDVAKLLHNMRMSGCRYLLITNNLGRENMELPKNVGGMSRFVDLLAPPYSFPDPLWRTDYMAMWRLDAIDPLFFDRLCSLLSK